MTAASDVVKISKIEGRVKEREECVSKFSRKYRTDLENKNQEYSIKDHITDLIGVRIVCLYEDEILHIKDIISSNFVITGVTDKIIEVEGTEATFGYKGLHVDLKHNSNRLNLPEYSIYKDFNVEVQIRTVVQDSWSIIDHKIKYKKSIPNDLKRRINTLAALFELADREFRAIRDATIVEIQKAETSEIEVEFEVEAPSISSGVVVSTIGDLVGINTLDAFSFEKVAKIFFKDFEFEPYKVDGFVQEIVRCRPYITRASFNRILKENILEINKYRDETGISMNPYTIIRHCLYKGDKARFRSILSSHARSNFRQWEQGQIYLGLSDGSPDTSK
ncbi:(p)ppGpp synthetase [Methylobacterium sp. 37f]|uniref:GTP pyrophosphokinase n=1 Tax=Methylobacterium sp. 37f TaxID=2817058 RepID=UPI001FFDB01A|nr:(p)ppGpp synthetase [Methylobacterium sp. 37f]MCK2055798.1 (p)ppGpp synthetase [Methylobacterium sp. 37f]